jgi:PadR family transcriptional regulator PadR
MFRKAALVQGSLDLLILQVLTLGPYHGLGLSRRISQVTQGAFDVNAGSLFPAPVEEQGWLSSEWREWENKRRAKFYGLTAAGRRQLSREAKNWQRIAAGIGRALQAT